MAVTVEVATASAPHESPQPHGRPGDGAAAARTELLFAEYGRTVSGLCRALLRDRAEAEDAAQQTFLSAHRALMNGTEPREPAAWLATIARNECWARIRTRMREPLATEELETVATANDPLAEAIRRADLAALWRAIEAAPATAARRAPPARVRRTLLRRALGCARGFGSLRSSRSSFVARHRLRGQLRAAYASISGASWIDALIRSAAGGGGAPVAAKVAALGVGAAAVGGGAVVVPHVLDNHRPSRVRARSRCRRPAAEGASARPDPSVSQSRGADGGALRAAPVRVRTTRNGTHGSSAEAIRQPSGSDGDRGDQWRAPFVPRMSSALAASRLRAAFRLGGQCRWPGGGERRGRRGGGGDDGGGGRQPARTAAISPLKTLLKQPDNPPRVVAGPGPRP